MNEEPTPSPAPDEPSPAAAPAQLPVTPVDSANCPSCNALVDVRGIVPFSRVQCPQCGKELEVPARFAHFLLLQHLGSGGMGTTFLAEDEQLGRRVAVKVIQRERLGEDPNAFETFKNEAQSAARLNHPHVAQVYSFGQEAGNPYLEMELVPGGDLAHFIVEGTTLDPAFVLRVGAEIAEGLKAAEEVGLFHGDVKPDNILFDENMGAKLVDFGIASRSSQGKTDELWGTPFYIAPEKVQKKMNSARSDIYSLGATLWHAIAGKPPYDGEDAVEVIKARFKGPPPPLESVRPDVEPEVARILSRMMYNDLFMRYPNYNSLLGDLRKYLAGVSDLRKQGPRAATAARAAALSGTKADAAPSAAAASDAAGAGGKKRFVIQKGQMEAAEARKEMEAATAAAGGGSRKVIRLGGAAEPGSEGAAPDAAKAEGKKKKGMGCFAKGCLISAIVLISLVLLGIVGAIVALVGSAKAEKRRSEAYRAEITEFEQDFWKVAEDVEPLLAAARQRDAAMLKEFKPLEDLAKKAFDASFEIPDLEPEPEPEEEAPAEEEAAPENAEAAPAAEAKPEMPKAPKKRSALDQYAVVFAERIGLPDPHQASDMIRKEAQAAGMTPEEYAREKLGDDYDDGSGDEGAAPEDVQEMADAMGAAMQQMGEQLGTAIVGAMGEALQQMGGQLGAALAGAAQLAPGVERSVLPHARAVRAALRDCEKLAAMEFAPFGDGGDALTVDELETLRNRREAAWAARTNQVAQMRVRLDAMDHSIREMRRGVARVVKDGQRFVRERERLEAEAAAAEAARQEELRKQEEAAAAAARGADEAGRVRTAAHEKQDLVDKFDYDTFVSRMKRMEGELTTPEGQAELKWTLDRIDRIQSLRKWIAEDIRRNGEVKRGYRRHDITGVSGDGKRILVAHMRESPEVAFDKLGVGDWFVLAQALLENRPPTRGRISPTDHATQLFNAAVFCYVHGNGNPTALAGSKRLAKLALSMSKGLQADAVAILPYLADEEEETAGTPSEAAAALDF